MFGTAQEGIYFRIETIAGNCHDVEISPIGIQPLLRDFRTIVYYRARFETKVLLTISKDFTDELGLQEGFTATAIQLYHSGISQ
jgi:hypothetical protein